MDDLEVDFVAVDQKQTIYYQVAATVRDEGTLKRELASLQKINDNYPKFILTLDEDPDADYEGIRRIECAGMVDGERMRSVSRAVLLPPGKQSLGGVQKVVGYCHRILGIRSVFRGKWDRGCSRRRGRLHPPY